MPQNFYYFSVYLCILYSNYPSQILNQNSVLMNSISFINAGMIQLPVANEKFFNCNH